MNEILDDFIIIIIGKGENKFLVIIYSEIGICYRWIKEIWIKMFRGLLEKCQENILVFLFIVKVNLYIVMLRYLKVLIQSKYLLQMLISVLVYNMYY